MENKEVYKKAKERVDAKIGFYIHLFIYIVLNILLYVINITTSPRHFWFKWAFLGLSISIFFHGVAVFVFSSAVYERMIEKEMEKLKLKKK